MIPLGKIVSPSVRTTWDSRRKPVFTSKRILGICLRRPERGEHRGRNLPRDIRHVLMVFIMSIVVMPFGIVAALYLREYARQGVMVRIVRICVNNLAGVPSIVFGVSEWGSFSTAWGA